MDDIVHRASRADVRRSLLIDNVDCAGEGNTLRVINPATEELVAEFSAASIAQVNQAVASAELAFNRSDWKKPAFRRAAIERLADLIEQNQDQLMETLICEIGTPINLKAFHIGMAVTYLRWFAEAATRDRTRNLGFNITNTGCDLGRVQADRRGRLHRGVQLSDLPGCGKDRRRAGRGMHHGSAAVAPGAPCGSDAGRTHSQSGLSARRGQHHRRRPGSGARADRAPWNRQGEFHRFGWCRQAGHAAGGCGPSKRRSRTRREIGRDHAAGCGLQQICLLASRPLRAACRSGLRFAHPHPGRGSAV